MARPPTPTPPPSMLTVHWYKCGEEWCKLGMLNLTHPIIQQGGVYVVLNPSPNFLFSVLYVGQGNFENRFAERKTDIRILQYATLDELYVTWAVVPPNQRDGVERFLADKLNPKVGEKHPSVPPTSVNLPLLVR